MRAGSQGAINARAGTREGMMICGLIKSAFHQCPFEWLEPFVGRMLVIGLAPSAVTRTEPGLVDELRRRCTCCGHVDRCTTDLGRQSTDQAWRHYCANAVLLDALGELWWLREII